MYAKNLETLVNAVRAVPDFPQKGVVFRDIMPILTDPKLFQFSVTALAELVSEARPDKLLAIESRGFIFGAPVSLALKLPLITARKLGKLPPPTQSVAYELEYGCDQIEIPTGLLEKGDRIVIIDDVLATGGTALAALQLVSAAEAKAVGAIFLIELGHLNGAEKLKQQQLTNKSLILF